MTVRAMPEPGRAEVASTRPTTPSNTDSTENSAFTLARGFVQARQPKRALEILEAELVNGRESAQILRLLARACLQLNDAPRALLALERAAELAPDDVVSHIRLARVPLQSGEWKG